MSKLELDLRNFINEINIDDEKVNYGCVCDYCGKKNFTEYRYKCLICQDYDLCGKCFEERRTTKEHVFGHPMHRFGKCTSHKEIEFQFYLYTLTKIDK